MLYLYYIYVIYIYVLYLHIFLLKIASSFRYEYTFRPTSWRKWILHMSNIPRKTYFQPDVLRSTRLTQARLTWKMQALERNASMAVHNCECINFETIWREINLLNVVGRFKGREAGNNFQGLRPSVMVESIYILPLKKWLSRGFFFKKASLESRSHIKHLTG